jgi:hypothetical protein
VPYFVACQLEEKDYHKNTLPVQYKGVLKTQMLFQEAVLINRLTGSATKLHSAVKSKKKKKVG